MIALDNAIKYSPPARSVTLKMTAADGHGEVVVRDEGSGIPAEEISHVFERFYRGPLPRQVEGAGQRSRTGDR